MRALFAALCAGLIACPAALDAQVMEQPSGPPVRVAEGLVQGKMLSDGVRAWLGVPFAEPPVRDLRWRDPQPHRPWQGVWIADRFAPECIQPLRSRAINHYFGEEATSEDCLYLNIWAPPAPPPQGTRYPVMVWIYGGGFNIGSAAMANYAGEPLAKKGVVYVSIGYRVGPLGFFAHPDLSAEQGGASGNYGLKDQVAALKWVRANIAAFGGDPERVTIAGQSAGSMSVSLLQASPAAKGLFHRVIGMSGGAFDAAMAPIPLAEAEAEGVALQRAAGASSLTALRDLTADRLIDVAATLRRRAVTVDGQVVREAPAASFAGKRFNDVPVMVGFTRDESFRSLGSLSGVASYRQAVRTQFPVNADAILAAYPAGTDAQVRRAARDIERDASVGRQMAGWAAAQAANGRSPAYAYFFTRTHPYTPGVTFADHDPATVGAYHTGDVPYWLGTLDSLNRFRTTRNWTAADRALSDAMMDAVVRFAATGNPGPAWPAFDPARPRMMQLDLERRVVAWPNHAVLPRLNETPPPPSGPGRVRD
ncbi:carboxylesterase family protein [Sphingomonas sp. BGYR3]|uniref:carboxylesterase/lipase family protein n=1 Tax=Sphingomonas sp. BGYR3 TaxID=2975483 RepID=UPI0021A48B30|nr:carboxylesterase family protein [Sphingomonas sp. BGYR3]MDG5489667.1 carboxylesterase family protein [Sphingomonas sp. BGYR3]